MKRTIVQIAATILPNLNLKGFASGTVFGGFSKHFCAPGLNCHACPGALLACPVGALQNSLGDPSRRFSFYVLGFIAAVGLVLGRVVCGFLCPFGLLQELLHLPARALAKRFPDAAKKLGKVRLPKAARLLKYVILALFVVILPLFALDAMGFGAPWFCEYVCPSGMVMGALPILTANGSLSALIGNTFFIKAAVTGTVILACLFSERFFCKYVCPLGAIYGLLNKASLYRMETSAVKCTGCGGCKAVCPMGVDPSKTPNSPECIRCGKCRKACPAAAITAGFRDIKKSVKS
jgi:polyferredoxin